MVSINNIKKRYMSLAVTILIVVVFALSGTYALFKWRSSDNTNVTFDANLGIVYNKEHDVLSAALNPATGREGGISTTIELWTTTTKTQVYGSLFLNVTSIASPLNTNDMLKWEVWSNNAKISEGNFNGFTSGDILEVLSDEILNNVQTFYTVYIWLDDSKITSAEISGSNFNVRTGASAAQLPNSESSITITDNSPAQGNYVNKYTLNLTATSDLYDIKGYAVTTSPETPTEFTAIANPSTSYNLAYEVTTNNKYYVWFRNQNNKIAYKIVDVTCIDNNKPVVAISSTTPTTYINSSTAVNIPLKITDTGSGINTNAFSVTDLNIAVGSTTINPTTKELTYNNTTSGIYHYNLNMSGITGNGTLKLNIPAGAIDDIAGNSNQATEITTNYIVDNTAPRITDVTANQLEDTITIDLVATDDFGDIKTYWYSIDGSNYYSSTNTNYNFSNVSAGNYTAYVYVEDKAGNTSSVAESEVIFDNIPPTLTSVNVTSASGTYAANNTINITATYSEPIYNSTGGALSASTAPTLSLKFGSGTARDATFVSASNNTITYQITVNTTDLGALSINSHSGTVYDVAGNGLNVTASSLGGNSVSASTKALIDTTYYTTLANAISGSGTTKTITMVNDTTECVTIPSGNTISLDLNGKTITCTTASTSAITNNGTLTINDSGSDGTITSTYYALNNTGSITLTKGTIKSTSNTAIYNNSTATGAGGTSLYINGGSVTATSGVGINNVTTGTITIANGTVKGSTSGIYNTTSGTINIGLSSTTLSATLPEVYSTGGSAYGVYMASGGTLNINNGAIYTSNTSVASAYYKGTATLTARSGYHITSAIDGSNRKSYLVSGVTQIQWRSGTRYCDSYECCGTTTSTETSSCTFSSPGSGWTRKSGSCDSKTNVSGTCKCQGGYTGSRSCSSSWVSSSSSCMAWCESNGATDTSSECSYSKSYAYYYTRTTSDDYCNSGQSSCSSGETSSCESYDVSWGSWGTTDKSGYSNCQKRTCNLDAEGNVTTCGSAGSC